MKTSFGDVLNGSALNLMNKDEPDITKTKEMIVGANVNPSPQLILVMRLLKEYLLMK